MLFVSYISLLLLSAAARSAPSARRRSTRASQRTGHSCSERQPWAADEPAVTVELMANATRSLFSRSGNAAALVYLPQPPLMSRPSRSHQTGHLIAISARRLPADPTGSDGCNFPFANRTYTPGLCAKCQSTTGRNVRSESNPISISTLLARVVLSRQNAQY